MQHLFALAVFGSPEFTESLMTLLPQSLTNPDRINFFVFYLIVAVTFLSKYYKEAMISEKNVRWTNIARVFPTLQMYKGAYLASDLPGPERLCQEWGGEGYTDEMCWEKMLQSVGDKTWSPIAKYKPHSKLAMSIIESFGMLVVMLPAYFLSIKIHSLYGTAGGSEGSAIVSQSDCGPLFSHFNSDKQYAGPDGFFLNGDVENAYGLACKSGKEIGATCEVICRPNYIPSPHYGNIAVCGLDSSQRVTWLPAGPVAAANMCVPDIVMASPGLELHYRGDVNSVTFARDFSGHGRHGVLPVGATQIEISDGTWVFSSTNQVFLVGDLPGESMFLRTGQAAPSGTNRALIDASIFLVVAPRSVDDYKKMIDIINLAVVFDATVPASCMPVDQQLHLVSLVFWIDGTTQRFSLRVDGVSCNSPTGVAVSRTLPSTANWHLFSHEKKSIAVIGCQFPQSGTAARGASCDSAAQFQGKIAEVVLYTMAGHNTDTQCALDGAYSVQTTCSRYRLEAIEFFLMTKNSIAPKFSCVQNSAHKVACSDGIITAPASTTL
eukprot:c7289_g1_i2.p1 GENE.c7289_g1_i2~~c7289_g1_i2.p1  ORF type:complete len:563 (+),score=129.05 c7289_g1_i2:42-1691(+)